MKGLNVESLHTFILRSGAKRRVSKDGPHKTDAATRQRYSRKAGAAASTLSPRLAL